ncbi:MAG TPA: efflux RND transporter permease subunit [Gemmatimonadales bacterium]|nr:efflux RND transporter permease subunit [Gemmatimonadales bacterium]
MRLSDIAIRRPVLASMMSAALVLFGAIAFKRLPVREFPDVDPPIISVQTSLRGANPRVMESSVTDILEEELSTVPGLRTLTSTSSEQSSNITLEFTLDRDIESAAQDVRDKVSRVRGRLPDDVEEPVVAKQDADASPFMSLGLSGEGFSMLQLSDIADRIVKTRLQTIPGVGRIQIYGERRYAMRIWLSARELSSRGLTVQDVEAAVRARNVEVPAGRIESARREFTVRALGELRTPEEFGNLVVSNRGGQLVKLRDLARVELGPENDRSALRLNGRVAVGLGIVRQSQANMTEIADRVREELPRIQQLLPEGVEVMVGFDQSVFVRRSIQEAEETLIIAGLLVVAIIFLFLRNLRATIIPGLAIPASIIATFAVLDALNFSINTVTLLALILAIGIVVDDAIIVLENAYRHQEELREDPETAALNGTREIAFAVIATTASLVAVFVPLTFLSGTAGRLFTEFAIAVAGAVIISGFVALTLTPMLCAKILRVPQRHGRLYLWLEKGFHGMAGFYATWLRRAVQARWAVVGIGVASLVVAGWLVRTSKREFVPPEDRGQFQVAITAPEGSTVQYVDRYQREIEQIMLGVPEVRSVFSIVGSSGRANTGRMFVRLEDWSERDRNIPQIIEEVRPQLAAISGVQAFANNPPAFGGFGQPVQFVLQHPDFDSLTAGMDALIRRARQIPGLINVDTDLRVNKPELTVSFDRDRAEDLGVPIRDIAGTLQTLLGGRPVSTFTLNNKLYDAIAQLASGDRATPSDMTGLYVRGRDGQLIQLDAVAQIREGIGPRQLNHYNRVRAATLTASLAPGFTLGEAIDSLQAVARQALPEGSSTSLAGESRELEESGSALYLAFLLALAVVFMVLASQFESLVHPFTVLLAVPLAITGALITLRLAGSSLNLYSQIGMILLIGLVTKNSILLVEYANQLKAKGMETVEAMLEAGRIRLRPILMTSVSTIMSAVPIALGLGAGSMSRRPLGYAIVGGVFYSTLLTLFLVPVAYILLDAARVRLRRPTRRALAAATCALLVIAAGCGGEAAGNAAGRGATAREGRPQREQPGGARAAVPVEVVTARTERVEELITGTGQIEAMQQIELRPEVEGRVVEILVQEGRPVTEGQALFRVDDAELQAQVARAEADRDLAEQTLQRTRQLIEQQAATQNDLERAEAQARAMRAQLELLRLRLSRTVVRAPFSGIAGARRVSVGDWVNNQTRLITLQTVSPIRATLNVPERYAELLRRGQQVAFSVAALRGRTFTGTVDFVDPVVTLPARTILIKAQVPNARGELQPGMFVEGRIVSAVRHNAVVIPEEAVLPIQGSAIVYVVRDGRAQRRTVELGVRRPGFVEVVRGVAAGEQVVIGGLERLTDGATVRTVQSSEGAGQN